MTLPASFVSAPKRLLSLVMFVFIGATVLAVVQAVLVVLGTVFGDPVPGRTDDA